VRFQDGNFGSAFCKRSCRGQSCDAGADYGYVHALGQRLLWERGHLGGIQPECFFSNGHRSSRDEIGLLYFKSRWRQKWKAGVPAGRDRVGVEAPLSGSSRIHQ
jgi:hypothetical protein